MENVTMAQGNQIFNLILQKQVSAEQLRAIIETGLLNVLLHANIAEINYEEFCRVCSFKPLTSDYGLMESWKLAREIEQREKLCQVRNFTTPEDEEFLRLAKRRKIALEIEQEADNQPAWMKGLLFFAERPLRDSLPDLKKHRKKHS